MTGYQSKKAAALDEEGMYLVHHTQPAQVKVEGPLHVVCQCDKCKAQPAQETVARVLQIIKELRPAIKPLEVMGKGKTTDEWFDILVKEIEQALKEKNT